MVAKLQTNSSTFYGRYLTETMLLRRYFSTDQDLKILSFGCSTGEELLLLRRLFPGARLYGCDVDWSVLASARALLGADAVIFDSERRRPCEFGPFDIIVCNSVLLSHTTGTGEAARGLEPGRWIQALDEIDEALKPGGLLQVINSQFPIRLHPKAGSYRALASPLILGPHFVDQFDLDGRLVCRGAPGSGWSAMLHRHIVGPGWKSAQPGDLSDAHFQKAGGARLEPIADQRLAHFPRQAVTARGTARFEPAETGSGASYLEIEVAWSAHGNDAVRVERTAHRVWFDGERLAAQSTVIEMQGPSATAFLESVQGRPSTSLLLDDMVRRAPITSSAF